MTLPVITLLRALATEAWFQSEFKMIVMWIGFIVFVLLLLALDLGVLNRKAHVIGIREALKWSAFWISLGLLFSVFVYFAYENHWLGIGHVEPGHILDRHAVTAANPTGDLNGWEAMMNYLLGYVIEKSLSVDNIFVIAVIFSYFAVPPIYQHRVLFWGILGALIMRGGMIAIGDVLIKQFSWVLYVFAVFLIFTGLKMLFTEDRESNPGDNFLVKMVKRAWPVSDKFHGEHFFVRAGSKASHEAATPDGVMESDPAVERMEKERPGTWMITPLFLALLMVEFTDLIFAVDSVPAIFTITTDPFLVFTSNVFAILGLRSLYFALAGLVDKFRYLETALAFVLMMVGVKIFAHDWLKATLGQHYNLYMLGMVVVILSAGVIASIVANKRDARREAALPTPPNS